MGLALGIVLIVLTFRLNLQKLIIVVGTALFGNSALIGTWLLGAEDLSLMRLAENLIQTMLQNSQLCAILYFMLAASGIFVQLMKAQTAEIHTVINHAMDFKTLKQNSLFLKLI